MLEVLTFKPEAFGLDISDLSLKIIKLKKIKNGFDLATFGEQNLKPGIIKGGEIKDEKALSEVIKEALNKVQGEKLKTKYVIASLPEEKAFLQVIQMPRMSEEELKSAVIYEAENYIPLPIEEVYLDSQVIPPVYPVRDYKDKEKRQRDQISNGVYNHLDHFDVLIAALPKKTVDPYLSVLKMAKLEPVSLEIESLSISRALIKGEVSAFPVLLIDLGATRTSFIIFSGHSLRFTSSIPVSSGNFTEIISKTLGVDLAEAEKLKIKYGLEEKIQINKIKKGTEKKTDYNPPTASSRSQSERAPRGKIFEALIPPLVDLIQQIERHLDYYQTHASHEHLPPNGKGVSKILLCGGGANLKGLPELLSLELKIPVELGNPWINILPTSLKELPDLPLEKSLAFTTAIGLALRGIKSQ